jgi:hypothetical protein
MIRPLVADDFVSEGVKSGDVWEGGEVRQGLAYTVLHLSGSLLREG